MKECMPLAESKACDCRNRNPSSIRIVHCRGQAFPHQKLLTWQVWVQRIQLFGTFRAHPMLATVGRSEIRRWSPGAFESILFHTPLCGICLSLALLKDIVNKICNRHQSQSPVQSRGHQTKHAGDLGTPWPPILQPSD